MNVHDALSQIADIRQQVARAQTFRGYRPATTAFTAVVAVVAAAVQAWLMPEPHARAAIELVASDSARYDAVAPGVSTTTFTSGSSQR
jgi:hypothetical protein